ncbi:MAG: hypothetical protein Q9187_004725 [Circinaria calcarea]
MLKKFLHIASVKNTSGQLFIPLDRLHTLITSQNILNHMSGRLESLETRLRDTVDNADRRTYLDIITSSTIRLFAILVLCEKEHFIFEFIQRGLDDNSLPLDTSSTLPQNLGRANDILTAQWQVLAPVFVQGRDYSFSTESVLPFVDEDYLGKDVERVSVYPSHMRLVGDNTHNSFQDHVLARKRIKIHGIPEDNILSSRDAFQREAAVLRSLLATRAKHRHIVELYGIYTMDLDHYILLSCGDYNLQQIFEMSKPPSLFGESMQEQEATLWGSLHCLASALDYLHNGTGQVINHHDIKPANILIKGCTFQLADFGLSGLKSQEDTKTDWHGGTYTYSPPEYFDKSLSNGQFGRSVDIWGLGCVFSEIATLAVYGWSASGVTKFKIYRQNGPKQHRYPSSGPDHSFHNNANEVEAWLNDLIRNLESSTRKQAIQTVKEMLHINPIERPTSQMVCARLKDLFF